MKITNKQIAIITLVVGSAIAIGSIWAQMRASDIENRPVVYYCLGNVRLCGIDEFSALQSGYNSVFVLVENTGKTDAPVYFTVSAVNATLFLKHGEQETEKLNWQTIIKNDVEWTQLLTIFVKPKPQANCFELDLMMNWQNDESTSSKIAREHGELKSFNPSHVKLCKGEFVYKRVT